MTALHVTLGTLTAADLGRRITLTGDVPEGFRTGVLVRIDHDLTLRHEPTTFVGFQTTYPHRPGVRLQGHGIRRPSTDPVTIHPETGDDR